MKRLIFTLSALLLTLAPLQAAYSDSTAGALDVTSLKAQALGYASLDVLDRSFDPIELQFVDGFRLFTNLGNYNGGQDRILGHKGSEQYLIGFASNNPFLAKLKNAAFLKFSNVDLNKRVTVDNNLDGIVDIDSMGQIQSEWTGFYDSDNNGLYDVKKSNSFKKSAFNLNDMSSFNFNSSYLISDLVIGAKAGYASVNAENQAASAAPAGAIISNISTGGVQYLVNANDPEYSYNYSVFDLVNGYMTLNKQETGSFKTTDDNALGNFSMSVMKPDFFGYELRGDLGYFYKNRKVETSDSHTGYMENNFLNSFENAHDLENYKNTLSESGSYSDIAETNGGTFRLAANLRQTFKKAEKRENDDFWEAGIVSGFGSYDYKNSWSRSLNKTTVKHNLDTDLQPAYFVADWTTLSNSKNEKLFDDGTTSTWEIGVGGRLNQYLNENVRFVSAASLDYYSEERTTDYTASYTEYEESITGQPYLNSSTNYFNDGADYRLNASQSVLGDRIYQNFRTSLSATTGIEFWFTENHKWVMRVSSIYTSVKNVTNDKTQINKADPRMQQTVYGNGDYNQIHADNSYASISNHKVTSTSNTYFGYGVGYNPNDNLQIDILGVFDGSGVADSATNNEDVLDLAFIKSLKLGFSLKF